ncbi:MAG: NAD-dependent epimerase/dehydratase family protein [Acidimicrobiales bacterium]
MRVVITGGFGFLGRLVARRVLDGGLVGPDGKAAPVTELVLVDQPGAVLRPLPVQLADPRVEAVEGDVGDEALLAAALAGAASVFHLASVVSADAEADFERAMAVNVDGLRALVAACRASAGAAPPRLVFASSVAVFGGAYAVGVVGDGVKQTPHSTYGVTKAIGELLVNEATRKGWIDGRSARLATVVVRPGRPNLAASSFASGLFREPLAGDEAVIPVPLDTPILVIGRRAAVAGLVALHDLAPGALGDDRAVGLPAMALTVGDMVEALRRFAAAAGRTLGPLTVAPDPLVSALVGSWPGQWDNTRALALGLPADVTLEQVIADYVADYGS